MTTKAAKYIEQLSAARCRGDWTVVTELVRKVRKHAPHRQCLALVAETECAISNEATASSSSRPSVAEVSEKLAVHETIPKLKAAADNEKDYVQDVFQARVCIGWLYWVVTDYANALENLPDGLPEAENDDPESLTEWTAVCAMKSVYLKANCFMRDNQLPAAIAAFESGLPSLDHVWAGQAVHTQLKYWSELYLTEYCVLISESIRRGFSAPRQQNPIFCFRSWARYWETMSAPVIGGFGFKGSMTSVPRRNIWREYYQGLSKYLVDDKEFPTANLGNISADTPVRTQLRMELKRVEASYEKLLLSEITFPRADEKRTEMEQFVKQVMDNWAILCGRGWSEKDLGHGGRAGISRGVLETLYNAATKTYHSTLILRSLFVIHVSLAEFDLGFKAFDSYLEIMKKGKARFAKTGIAEPSLDTDDIVLETMARAIMTLCLYGHHKAAERARRLGAELEDWLSKLPPNKSGSETNNFVPPRTMALAWQAIGFSHAQWSRCTYEAASRTEIQAKAIRCLRKSISSEYGRSKDTRSIFALGLLLAERKDLSTAIEIVRSALMSGKRDDNSSNDDLYNGPYWQERSLIPMWHLLALLLSARQDYAMADRACDAAVEQFKDLSIIFGKAESSKSHDVNEAAEVKPTTGEAQGGLIDEMDDFEKESLLEVKMTQLTLIELQDGPNAAVNSSYELFSLFTRFFGSVSTQPNLGSSSDAPAKTFYGHSSLRGAIFGSKDRPRPISRQSGDGSSDKTSVVPIRPRTAQTAAPCIQVTSETLRPSNSRRSSINLSGPQPRRNSLRKRSRSLSRGRTPVNGTPLSPQIDGEFFFTPTPDGNQAERGTSSTRRPPVAMASTSLLSREGSVPSIYSLGSNASRATSFSELSFEVTHAPVQLVPLVQFSKDKERARRTCILIKIWIMIAGFYRRAHMLDECNGAILEGQKLVLGLETEAARDAFGAGAMKSDVWAEKKSVEALWGDVFSQLGLLALARNNPFEARADFESALTHCPDHAAAITGLSGILLDIYTEKLLPAPAIAALENDEVTSDPASVAAFEHACKSASDAASSLPSLALGLGPCCSASTDGAGATPAGAVVVGGSGAGEDEIDAVSGMIKRDVLSRSNDGSDDVVAPYKTTSLPLSDRLAARDRAYSLLSGLTRLGSAWDCSEAWFALARAYEESGQVDKAKEALWWCIELEEANGVRSWRNLGAGGYII